MNGDFKGFFYCLDLSFYKKCNGARQVTFINVETVVESSRNIKKLSRKKSTFSGIYLSSMDTVRTRSRHWACKVSNLNQRSKDPCILPIWAS